MTFKNYSSDAAKTMVFTGTQQDRLNYASVALGGEAGEYLNEYKKWLRTGTVKPYDERRDSMLLELGDILWYLNRVAVELDSSLEEVAIMNIVKLKERHRKAS